MGWTAALINSKCERGWVTVVPYAAVVETGILLGRDTGGLMGLEYVSNSWMTKAFMLLPANSFPRPESNRAPVSYAV